MKKMLPVALVLGLLPLGNATAQSIGSNPTGLYVGATAGVHFFEDEGDADLNFDEGGSLGAQIGYRFSDHLRTELEAEAIGANIDDSDNADLALGRVTAGLYYDFANSDFGFVPYVGAGIGFATGTLEGFSDEIEEDVDIDESLSWHAEAGISLNLNPHIALVPSYRYTRTDIDDVDGIEDLTSHALRVGLRATF